MMLRFVPLVILIVFVLLILGEIFQNSPVQSEDAHIASGVHHWTFGNFDLYRVNPPLVRGVAALPVYLFCPITPSWENVVSYPLVRCEHPLGVDYARANKEFVFQLRLARITCLLFALLGGWICYFFATKIYGPFCGFVALLLWCFSPYILGHASTIHPDAHTAAFAILAVLSFHKWLKVPDAFNVVIAGLVLGLAELCKFTLLIFYPLFVLIWILYQIPDFSTMNRKDLFLQARTQAWQLVIIFATSLLVINMGYLFENTGKPLGSFRFRSRSRHFGAKRA